MKTWQALLWVIAFSAAMSILTRTLTLPDRIDVVHETVRVVQAPPEPGDCLGDAPYFLKEVRDSQSLDDVEILKDLSQRVDTSTGQISSGAQLAKCVLLTWTTEGHMVTYEYVWKDDHWHFVARWCQDCY